MIEFPYRAVESPVLGVLYRPLVQVRLHGPTGSRLVWILADSGADVSLLPCTVATYLGIVVDLSAPDDHLGGIAGEMPISYGKVEIELGGERFPVRVAWGPPEAPALLGQLDVFDRFDVVYRKSKGVVQFIPAA